MVSRMRASVDGDWPQAELPRIRRGGGRNLKKCKGYAACGSGGRSPCCLKRGGYAFQMDDCQASQSVATAVQLPVGGAAVCFRAELTHGDGSCGIHALCGNVRRGEYWCPNARQILLDSFADDYESINDRLTNADVEGLFWPLVCRYMWNELFLGTENESDAKERHLFREALQEAQPDVHRDALSFLAEEAAYTQVRESLWQGIAVAARCLFEYDVWNNITQHAFVNVGLLPGLCDDMGRQSWSGLEERLGTELNEEAFLFKNTYVVVNGEAVIRGTRVRLPRGAAERNY